VNEQVSDVSYTKSLGVSGTAMPMCSSGGTEFSPLKVPELMQTILSMPAVLTVVVSLGGLKSDTRLCTLIGSHVM